LLQLYPYYIKLSGKAEGRACASQRVAPARLLS